MRAAWFGSVMILALLASGVWAESRGSPSSTRPGRSKRSGEDANTAIWKVTVKGYGVADFEAHQDALKKGLEELKSFLQEHQPPFVWHPNTDYIALHLVKTTPEIRLVKDTHHGDKGDLDEEVGQAKEEKLTIEITRGEYQEILRQDRMARSDQRMIFLGKVMAGLVALFGVFAGYFRLEEATKGFYTAWLRLGAVGLVAAVGAGLYWFR